MYPAIEDVINNNSILRRLLLFFPNTRVFNKHKDFSLTMQKNLPETKEMFILPKKLRWIQRLVYLFAAHLFAFKFPRCYCSIGDASKSINMKREREQSDNRDNCGPSLNAVAVAMVTNSPDQSGTAFQMFAFIHPRERYGYPWLRAYRALTRWNSHFRKLHPSHCVLTEIN